MREIKFRAWDKKLKVMVAEFLPDWDNVSQERYELMQYTGLKDKNGTDIYEGDVVKFCFWDGDQTNRPTKISSVVWNEDGAAWDMKTGTVNGLFRGQHYYEIIGNIYENKDLLK